jgi:cardiolipin synthase
MHAKIVCVDSLFSTVGSFNFDWFSGRRNLEVALSIFDHALAREFETLHQQRTVNADLTPAGFEDREDYSSFFARLLQRLDEFLVGGGGGFRLR